MVISVLTFFEDDNPIDRNQLPCARVQEKLYRHPSICDVIFFTVFPSYFVVFILYASTLFTIDMVDPSAAALNQSSSLNISTNDSFLYASLINEFLLYSVCFYPSFRSFYNFITVLSFYYYDYCYRTPSSNNVSFAF